jgi:flagellar motor switch protein FliM
MQRVLQKCCQELSAVWAPVKKLDFRLQSIEANPELARVVGPSEMAILVSLELRMSDVSGMLNLCLPYVVMEPAIQGLGQGGMSPRSVEGSDTARKVLERTVAGATVTLDVDLGVAELTLGEIASLEPGDVLQWSPAAEGGAVAAVEGMPRFAGEPGRSRGRVAFRITGPVSGPPGRKEEKS